MANTEESMGVDWVALKEALPASTHAVLDALITACEANPDDLDRAVVQATASSLGDMRRRFGNISTGSPS